MIHHISPIVYVPFLILSLCATVIASQAMISGMFSIVYQGMTTRILPKMKVEYTSPKLQSQIYIRSVNWMLLAAVLVVMFEFRSSENLASAYGLAVSGSMMISALMMAIIFLHRKKPVQMILSASLIIIDGLFFISTLFKIPHGAFWSFIIAAIPLIIIVTFILGQDKLHAMLRSVPMEEFLRKYRESYETLPKIRGTALFFMEDVKILPPISRRSFSRTRSCTRTISSCQSTSPRNHLASVPRSIPLLPPVSIILRSPPGIWKCSISSDC